MVVMAYPLPPNAICPTGQVRVEARRPQLREHPDRDVLALPGGDLGDVAEQAGLAPQAKPLAQARR